MKINKPVHFQRFCCPQFPVTYPDRKGNRECWKLKGYDTLIYFPAGQRGGAKEDSIVSLQVLPHADTVLGRICNRLELRTSAMPLSLPFDPTMRIDPEWFKSAKINYYDVVYGTMRSVFLKMVWTTPQFTVTTTAINVQRRLVHPEEFAVATALPATPAL